MNADRQRPRTPEETPSPDAVVVRPGEAETGDPPTFVYRGRARVCVGGAARTSFVQPVTTPPVSDD